MREPELRVHVTRRNFVRGVGLLSAQAALAACSNSQSATSAETGAKDADEEGLNQLNQVGASPMLAIIHTNDTHGHDVEVESTENAQGNFSMAAVASLKAEWEKKGYEVLLMDAGDATQGMPMVDLSDGEPAIAFMNSCGYDVMAVGNHEFDWGQETLEKNIGNANFPVISANVVMRGSDELRFKPNTTFTLADGTKIGVFGLTTATSLTTTMPTNVADLDFLRGEDLLKCAQAQIDELRGDGCDLVICLAHLGNDETSEGNSSIGVLEGTKGIDLFIDGHDHREVEMEVEGTLLVETGCFLHNIGVVVIDEGIPKYDMVPYGTYDGIDEATQAMIDDEYERTKELLGAVIAETPYFLDGNRDPGVRTQETNLGDLCADAYLWAAKKELPDMNIDAALINAGGIRASIDVGDITVAMVKAVFPFANELRTIEVTGEQLLEAIECACQGIGYDSALGAFPQVSGITFSVNASVPYEQGEVYPDSIYVAPAAPGTRVTITDVGGRGFDLDATYTIATSSFIAVGGDTYYVFKEASQAKEPVPFGFDYDALGGYLIDGVGHKVPEAYAEPQGRITIIYETEVG